MSNELGASYVARNEWPLDFKTVLTTPGVFERQNHRDIKIITYRDGKDFRSIVTDMMGVLASIQASEHWHDDNYRYSDPVTIKLYNKNGPRPL